MVRRHPHRAAVRKEQQPARGSAPPLALHPVEGTSDLAPPSPALVLALALALVLVLALVLALVLVLVLVGIRGPFVSQRVMRTIPIPGVSTGEFTGRMFWWSDLLRAVPTTKLDVVPQRAISPCAATNGAAQAVEVGGA